MSYMRGDLLTRTRKLVKGFAIKTPVWLKAMEAAPPVSFPRTDGKIQKMELPEDVYVKKFFKKNPDSLYHDAVKISGFDPPPARIFAWRVLELKAQGVSDQDAMAVADMEYQAEKKEKKKAYSELKKLCRLQGKKLPPNPYPSPIKEIQAEEKKYVRDRFFNPKILELVKQMKEAKAAEMQERGQRQGFNGAGNNDGNGGGGQFGGRFEQQPGFSGAGGVPRGNFGQQGFGGAGGSPRGDFVQQGFGGAGGFSRGRFVQRGTSGNDFSVGNNSNGVGALFGGRFEQQGFSGGGGVGNTGRYSNGRIGGNFDGIFGGNNGGFDRGRFMQQGLNGTNAGVGNNGSGVGGSFGGRFEQQGFSGQGGVGNSGSYVGGQTGGNFDDRFGGNTGGQGSGSNHPRQ